MEKYKLTDNKKHLDDGTVLYQIQALTDIESRRASIRKGELGGWIQKESNLSQNGECWIDKDAIVYGYASVRGDALISEMAVVYGNAKVLDNAYISGHAHVDGNVEIAGNVYVHGDAHVYGNAILMHSVKVYGNAEVYDNAVLRGKTYVFDNAKVHGNSETWDNATIYGNAEICGTNSIHDSVAIGGDGYIDSTRCYYLKSLTRLTKKFDDVTFYTTRTGDIEVSDLTYCDGFRNIPLDDFIKKVKDAYPCANKGFDDYVDTQALNQSLESINKVRSYLYPTCKELANKDLENALENLKPDNMQL